MYNNLHCKVVVRNEIFFLPLINPSLINPPLIKYVKEVIILQILIVFMITLITVTVQNERRYSMFPSSF